MKRTVRLILLAALLTTTTMPAAASSGPQSPLRRLEAGKPAYPKVVIYTTSWCPYCKAAKEYLTANNIPFINRDIDLDEADRAAVTEKYLSRGVPVIVIGNDEKVLRGFDPETFQKAMREVREKGR